MLGVGLFDMRSDMLRLCTYNVLADKYAISGLSDVPETVEWRYRGPRLVQVLERISADLFFLQEVEEPVCKKWISHFGTIGYDGVSFHHARFERVVVATETVGYTASGILCNGKVGLAWTWPKNDS